MAGNGIDRRGFLIAGAAGLAALSSTKNALATELIASPSAAGRQIVDLNHGWLYSENAAPGSSAAVFNDRAFKTVNLPHTNKLVPLNGFDEHDYMFVSVYRKHFRLPAIDASKRIFVDFDGVMTAAKVYLNGEFVGENNGGYNDFSFEITKLVKTAGDNVLAVEVDSTERKDIPPFGDMVDYLTFGGIYRDVRLRIVDGVFIENVFARTSNVLRPDRTLHVRVSLSERPKGHGLVIELSDGWKTVASQTTLYAAGSDGKTEERSEITIDGLEEIELWDVDHPKLYDLKVTLEIDGRAVDSYSTRIGFRDAKFTPDGFFLNGKVLKLRGLNRHQTFPWVGGAMPARVQRRDAWILKKELKCNIVRTSHYMQSPHFLDACDELGLLVLEEIPGWQHIGDKAWQDLAVRDLESMITRDRNRPSIVLWGVRINESRDDHDFYSRTNLAARLLDPTRQTGGVRYRYDSEFLEDVFTMNEFRFPLRPPRHPRYLITETNGHMYPTKRFDNVERVREHTHRHARFHDGVASDKGYAGGLAWCAFDYNTHDYFGSGDRICYHGVSDIFRIPKPAAGFYRSQCDPSEEIVIEPGFDWARGDENETFTDALVCSNCEKLKFYIGDRMIAEVEPDRKTYPSLKYAPFRIDLHAGIGKGWDDLTIEGYIGGKLVKTRKMSAKGVERDFVVKADDTELNADGIDMTRVVFKVTDEYGNTLPFAFGAIQFTITNGEIVGENPAVLIGGSGAVWVRSAMRKGPIKLVAKHPRHGSRTIEIRAV